MFKIKKGIVLIAVVIVSSAFVYYRYATKVFQANRQEDAVPVATIPVVASKEVSAVVKYMATEDKEDTLRFILTVDKQGTIIGVSTVDAATNEVPPKKIEFNQGLSVVITGKKLSGLTAVDKIGKSSLTTKAFNSAIDELKAQL